MTTRDTTPADRDRSFPEWLRQSSGFQVPPSATGQLTIPAIIRQQLGLAPGNTLIIRLAADGDGFRVHRLGRKDGPRTYR